MKKLILPIILLSLLGCRRQDLPGFLSTKVSDECPFGDVARIHMEVWVLDPDGDAIDKDSLRVYGETEYLEDGSVANFSQLYPHDGKPLHTEFRYLHNYILAVSEDSGMNNQRYISKVKRNKVIVTTLNLDGSGFTDTDRFSGGRLIRKERDMISHKCGWKYRYDGPYISEVTSYGMEANHTVRYEYLDYDSLSNWLSRVRYVSPVGSFMVIERTYEEREIFYR